MEGPSIGLNYWYSATDLCLGGVWVDQWYSFVNGLSHGSIRLGDHEESLLWLFDKKLGMVSAKKSYALIVSEHLQPISDDLLPKIWGFYIPQKLKCFIWMVVNNKINTWDNL